MIQINTDGKKERKCKKCGDPIRSTNKYKYCDNCRRERVKAIKEIGTATLALCGMVISCIPAVKHLKRK